MSRKRKRTAVTSQRSDGSDAGMVMRDAFESLLLQARAEALRGGKSAAIPLAQLPELAMNIATVHSCVRIVAGSIAQLPLRMYERNDGGLDQLVTSHPLAEFFRAPEWSPWMTRFDQLALMITQRLLWGNAYWEMVWERGTGNPVEFTPRHPSQVTPKWSQEHHDRRGRPKLVYQVQADNESEELFDGDMLAFRSSSTNGVIGLGIGQGGGQFANLSYQQEKIAVDFCTKSAKPSIVVKVPGALPVDVRPQFLKDIETQHSGGKPLVLEYGSEASTLDIPFAAAQLLDSRKYQARVIASWFGVMPHQLGDTDGAKYDNVEALDANYVKYTLVPILMSVVQEMSRKLLTDEEQARYYFEFQVDALLRGAQTSRYAAYQSSVGWQTIDEIRSKENLPALPNGEGSKLYQLQIIADPNTPASPSVTVDPIEEEPALLPDPETLVVDTPAPASKPRSKAARDRYQALARSVLEGLWFAEKIQITKAANSPDKFALRSAEHFDHFYAKHVEKFGNIPELEIEHAIRRGTIGGCVGEADLPAAVEMCLHGLSVDPLLAAIMKEWDSHE